MLQIPDAELTAEASRLLGQYQTQVDLKASYAERVAEAKSLFKKRNTKTNPAFRQVRKTLTGMCSGLGRCMYCEDAPADEVEHHSPKDLYPDLVFAWSNYLYACGPCNGPKNNRFAVIDSAGEGLIDVSRPFGAPVIAPHSGKPALLDPRQEDPFKFLILDLRDTFNLVPLADPGSISYLRADYTIKVLRLNERDYLVEGRANAFEGYRARLRDFIDRRDSGAPSDELGRLVRGIRAAPHATVWAEMKRQHRWHPELLKLFARAPEALDF